MKTFTTNICSLCLLLTTLIPFASKSQSSPNSSNHREEMFSTCAFRAMYNSDYIRFKNKNNGDQSGCTINFSAAHFETGGGMKIILLITPRKDINQNSTSAGFKHNEPDKWDFIGYTFANPPYKFKNTSLTKKIVNESLILIGRQTESATTPQGDLVVLGGISIFRISPDFLASIQLAFEPDTPQTTRDLVENDLIKIVESVNETSNAISP